MASSREEQRQPNIPRGNYLREEAVNPQGIEEVPSPSPAQTTKMTREVHTIHLMEQVVERNNLLQALHRVERNKGAAGVDGMATKSLRSFLLNNWSRLREDLLNGTYQPLPVRRVEIPKPDGGKRLLGIPAVIDRLIQQALLQVLTPIFDPKFSPMSFGFRPGRGAHQAVKVAQMFMRQGFRHVVDMCKLAH
jgi:RNA-directed DNA polymerase